MSNVTFFGVDWGKRKTPVIDMSKVAVTDAERRMVAYEEQKRKDAVRANYINKINEQNRERARLEYLRSEAAQRASAEDYRKKAAANAVADEVLRQKWAAENNMPVGEAEVLVTGEERKSLLVPVIAISSAGLLTYLAFKG